MNVTTALESTQEQRVTPLVENDNQQQIYRWVRNHLLLPSGRRHHTDWGLHQSVQERIFLKSSCAVILERQCSFNPMVYSTDGIPGTEAVAAQRRLASLLSNKLKREYSEMCGFFRASVALSIVQSNTLLLWGLSYK